MCGLNLGIISLIRKSIFKELLVVKALARKHAMKKGKIKAFP
jgi:hypothetical protein